MNKKNYTKQILFETLVTSLNSTSNAIPFNVREKWTVVIKSILIKYLRNVEFREIYPLNTDNWFKGFNDKSLKRLLVITSRWQDNDDYFKSHNHIVVPIKFFKIISHDNTCVYNSVEDVEMILKFIIKYVMYFAGVITFTKSVTNDYDYDQLYEALTLFVNGRMTIYDKFSYYDALRFDSVRKKRKYK